MRRDTTTRSGIVHFVGAGPGDPELLTLKAARLLSEAEVVVYDRLVSPEILDRVPHGATRLYVGKMAGSHPVPQEQINALLVDLAKAGKRVVRLKGGDPFVFGRGSEEAAHLARAGIAFTVVPGITSASGCGAAFGIPLTHRGLATGVRYITGHCRDDENLDLDWRGLADAHTTLVVYMGAANLPIICARLIAAGMPADTPCAAIADGTTPRQRICHSTVERVAEAIVAEGLGSPLLVIVGAVVAFGQRLAGSGARPTEAHHAPRLVVV
ncbi:MAG: uroporphyrinogen-III C-methyltransferase [Alphaproteobacteria bacterium]|nr:uroporphyrinogen-III C-methyltransferase [Alphaproteobacteria bacterium]